MNYFLDFGTHFFNLDHPDNVGKGPNGLLTCFFEKGFMKDGLWNVQTYEPSKSIYKANILEIQKISSKFYSFRAINAAVLDYTGKVNFNMLEDNPAASNCHGIKINEYADSNRTANNTTYEVECIDVKEIVEEIINKDDTASIFIKCDIEGSEFKVIPRLLQIDNLNKYLKEIYIEWHERYWENQPDRNQIHQIKEDCLRELSRLQIKAYTHW